MGVVWNPEVKLVISGIDETIADLYAVAEPEVIMEFVKYPFLMTL